MLGEGWIALKEAKEEPESDLGSLAASQWKKEEDGNHG